MKIGIMGGTFNPPHIGHLHAAAAAHDQLKLEKIIFIPAGIPPHKKLPPNSPTPEQRLEMTRIAARELPYAVTEDMELRRAGPSYTVDTLGQIKRAEDELFLICGTDMFLTIDKWRHAEDIMRMCTLTAAARNHDDRARLIRHSEYLYEKYGHKAVVLSNDVIEISSTELRKKLSQGEDDMLTRGVYEYILKNGLYR